MTTKEFYDAIDEAGQLHKFVSSINKDALHTEWHVSELCNLIETLNDLLGELVKETWK